MWQLKYGVNKQRELVTINEVTSGKTSLVCPFCDRLPEIERALKQHYSSIDISVLGTWQHRGNVELYFKHRYKEFNYRIGKLTEYYRFKDFKAVLEDLRSMKQKVLEEVELEILLDKTKAIV